MNDIENKVYHFDNLLLMSDIFSDLSNRFDKLEQDVKDMDERFTKSFNEMREELNKI